MSETLSEDERVIEIEAKRLRDFKDHPFKITEDLQMRQLMDSIHRYGILSPLVVRPLPEGVYEIISGHRRKYAAKMLGFRKVPVVIRVMKDADAVIAMVDSNLQREVITYSEKAFAYRMKYEALLEKKRSDKQKYGGQFGHKGTIIRTVQVMGEDIGMSPKQVQRYLKLTELIPELRDMLDDGMISFNPAYEIAFLSEEEQKRLVDTIRLLQSAPSLSQVQRMKRLSQEGKLTEIRIRTILSEIKKGEINRVMFKNEQLYRFFPREYSAERMKQEILDILKEWMKRDCGAEVFEKKETAEAISECATERTSKGISEENSKMEKEMQKELE